MKYIYILHGCWNYEGSDTLGAFTTLKKAKDFEKNFKAKKRAKQEFGHDYYFIEKVRIDKTR